MGRQWVERPLSATSLYGRSWPNAPIDEPRLNGRCRGIAAVGSGTLNASKGSILTYDSAARLRP
jgi:hypothetical protein